MGGRSAYAQRAVADYDAFNRDESQRRTDKRGRKESVAKHHARAETEAVKAAGFRNKEAARRASKDFHSGKLDHDPSDSKDEQRRKRLLRRDVKRIPAHYYSEYAGLKRTQKASDDIKGRAKQPKKDRTPKPAEEREHKGRKTPGHAAAKRAAAKEARRSGTKTAAKKAAAEGGRAAAKKTAAKTPKSNNTQYVQNVTNAEAYSARQDRGRKGGDAKAQAARSTFQIERERNLARRAAKANQ